MKIRPGVLFVLCSFFSVAVLGDNADSIKTSPSYGISLGVHIDYEIGDRYTSPGVTFNASPKIGYSAGALIRMNLKGKFLFETGIRWTAIGVKNQFTHPKYLIEDTCTNCPQTYLPAVEIKSSGYLFYLAIPLNTTHYFGDGPWLYSLSAGPILNLRLGYQYDILYKYENGYTEDFVDYDTFLYEEDVLQALDLGFSLGFGFERDLTDGFALQIRPEWQIYSLIGLDFKTSWRKYTSSGIKIVVTKN